MWPIPVISDLVAALRGGDLLTYAAVIVPMGLFNVLGSLQNIKSAEAAGDGAVAGGQRHRHHHRRDLRLVLPHDHLHRPSGLEGARRARGVFDPERRIRDPGVRDRHARGGGVGRPDPSGS